MIRYLGNSTIVNVNKDVFIIADPNTPESELERSVHLLKYVMKID